MLSKFHLEEIQLSSLKYIANIFLVISLLFFNFDTLTSIVYFQENLSVVFLFLLTGTFLLVNFLQAKFKYDKKSLIFLIFLIFIVLFVMFYFQDFRGGYFVLILNSIIAFAIINMISFYDFSYFFISFISFLSLYSIIILIIINPFVSFLNVNSLPVFVNSTGLSFINYFFTFVLDSTNYFRNFGIFREPGVFAVFLNLALFFNLFIKSKQKKFQSLKSLILLAGVFSTFSTPGIITSSLFIFVFVLKKSSIKELFVFASILFISFFSIYVVLVILGREALFVETFESIFLKIYDLSSSLIYRLLSIYINVLIFIKSPILGLGITNSLVVEFPFLLNTNFPEYLGVFNTSTTGSFFSSFGIFFGFATFYYFLILFYDKKFSFFSKILIFSAVFLLLNSQLLIYNGVTFILIFYGYYKKVNQISFYE